MKAKQKKTKEMLQPDFSLEQNVSCQIGKSKVRICFAEEDATGADKQVVSLLTQCYVERMRKQKETQGQKQEESCQELA